MKRSIAIIIGALLALLVTAPMASGQVADTTSATPERARELSAAWWPWALEKPTANSPLNGSYKGGPQCNGRSDDAGEAWFLAGTITGEKIERTCTVPAGREIFFPVYNLLDFNVEGAQTEEELREEVRGWTDEALADPEPPLFATVDGQPVEMNRLDSPSALFHFTLLDDSYVSETFGIEPGPYVGVTDGVWVTLPQLSKGKHTVHFGGNGQDNTYYLKAK